LNQNAKERKKEEKEKSDEEKEDGDDGDGEEGVGHHSEGVESHKMAQQRKRFLATFGKHPLPSSSSSIYPTPSLTPAARHASLLAFQTLKEREKEEKGDEVRKKEVLQEI